MLLYFLLENFTHSSQLDFKHMDFFLDVRETFHEVPINIRVPFDSQGQAFNSRRGSRDKDQYGQTMLSTLYTSVYKIINPIKYLKKILGKVTFRKYQ
jgi:hypothetical protein